MEIFHFIILNKVFYHEVVSMSLARYIAEQRSGGSVVNGYVKISHTFVTVGVLHCF